MANRQLKSLRSFWPTDACHLTEDTPILALISLCFANEHTCRDLTVNRVMIKQNDIRPRNMRILRTMTNAFDCGNIEFLLTFLQSKGFFRPTLKVNKIESKPQSLMITLIIDIGLYNRLKNLVNQRVICEQECMQTY